MAENGNGDQTVGKPLGASGLQGLDRKAMEEERLARLSKKREAESQSPHLRAAKVARQGVGLGRASASEAIQPDLTGPAAHTSNGDPIARAASAPSLDGEIRNRPKVPFPHGAVRKTWALGQPRQSDIKIEEVLHKRDLNIAVLSSWQLDMEWIASKVDLSRTKLMLVMEGKEDDVKEQWQREAQEWSKSLRVVFPPMGRGIYDRMHSKLMLLFYPDYMRVVVPSANLVPYDWGETGAMENVRSSDKTPSQSLDSPEQQTIFLIDLPRLQQNPLANPTPGNAFQKSLHYFLKAMHLPADVISSLSKFDFSATSHLAFVHSISGHHIGEDPVRSTGYPLLARSVRDLGLETTAGRDDLQIDFATGSLGSLDRARMEALYATLRGWGPALPTGSRRQNSLSSALGGDETKPLEERVRIFFPSTETVTNSIGGTDSAGTIFLNHSTHSTPAFPRHLLRDFVSTRKGLLSHSKLIFARTPTTSFLYTGSANLSQAAWGNLTFDRKATDPNWGCKGSPKLHCGNWECGVLMRVRQGPSDPEEGVQVGQEAGGGGAEQQDKGQGKEKASAEAMGMDEAFSRRGVDVPMDYPGVRVEDAGRGGPWIVDRGSAGVPDAEWFRRRALFA